MDSKEYREILDNFIIRARLHQSIASIYKEDLVEKLLLDLNDPEFSKSATIEQLYDLRGRLFQLEAFSSGLVKAIKESKLNFLGEFDDKKMDLTEIGISNGNFICVKEFEDPFSNLRVLEGTIIKVVELSYANVSNMITTYYRTLKTSNKEQKLIEVFKDGKQATLLNLKILSENFKQL